MSKKASTPRKTTLPAIPEIDQSQEGVDRALKAIKEGLEVGYGNRGDPMDRFATLRDLQAGGFLIQHGHVMGGAGSDTGGGTGPGLPPLDDGPNYGDDDYTKPPRPQNVRAQSIPPDTVPGNEEEEIPDESLGIVMVTWDAPDYGNHYYTEVYRVPHGAEPADEDGKPLFPLAALNLDYAHGAMTPDGPNTSEVIAPAGVATGTIFVDYGLPQLPLEDPEATELDSALSPGRYYYWVRFVSRAMVPSDISDRAEASLSINPVRVLDAMTRNVTDTVIFRNLREWLALGSEEAQQGGSIFEYIDHQIEAGLITSTWSVRMQHDPGTGLVYAAGFGMGMETDTDTGRSLSTFLVNANQFAVMGNRDGLPGVKIRGVTLIGSGLELMVANGNHGLEEGDEVVISAPAGSIRVDEETTVPVGFNYFAEVSGIDAEVVSVGTIPVGVQTGEPRVVIRRKDGLAWPPGVSQSAWLDHRQVDYLPAAVAAMNGVLLPAVNIPFIVDTARGVVGIRGKLVVDGLVRATEGEFNNLRANTAFIEHLQSEVVNANVVIGQRIIAGVPGSGAVNYNSNEVRSNYIIELANPAVSQYPLLFWKPQDGINSRRFSLNDQGDIYVGGNMEVAGSGVIAGNDNFIFSTGGQGEGSRRFPLWIGARPNFGTNGTGRRLDNALFAIDNAGNAAFDVNLFLGGNPLAVPSGNGFITVKPAMHSPNARVFVTAGFVFHSPDSGEAADDVWMRLHLFLVPANHHSPGAGVQFPSNWYEPSQAFVNEHVGFYGVGDDMGPHMGPGWLRVASTHLDSRGRSRNVKTGTLQGSIVVPAGDYKVFMAFQYPKLISGHRDHGCTTFAPFVMQVSNDPTGTAMHPGDIVSLPSNPPTAMLPRDDSPADAVMMESSLFIPAGRFVHIHDTGEPKIELADATLGRPAHGFILESADVGRKVRVLTIGCNDRLAGLVPGTEYALGADGEVVPAADAPGPGSLGIFQSLGTAMGGQALAVQLGTVVRRE